MPTKAEHHTVRAPRFGLEAKVNASLAIVLALVGAIVALVANRIG